MRKKTIISFFLLFVFVSFLISHYPGGNIKALNLQKSKTVAIVNDAMEGSYLYTDKKLPFDFMPITVNLLYLTFAAFLLGSLLVQINRKFIFFTPVFYQANYLIRTPYLSKV